MRVSTSLVSMHFYIFLHPIRVYYPKQDLDGIFYTTENLWNEGSPFVTTCPLAPGNSFTYTVDLSEFGQTGTYWYHR